MLDATLTVSDGQFDTGTSIFDPTLCELMYRWFCPVGGTVLDPFAGGSVRGIVAAMLERRYVGVDLSDDQIASNREQAAAICAGVTYPPEWRLGDSCHIATIAGDVTADLVFSCPPYWNLEEYSDDPRDLSNMSYAQFRTSYNDIIRATLSLLRNDRFACFVVGDVRDKDGFFVGLPGDTVKAFEQGGARLYNEAVLLTAVGSLPIRAGRFFTSSRKFGRAHQNILIFVKGSAKRAAEACGTVD